MNGVSIRFLQPVDIPAVLKIQSASLEAAQWPQSAHENLSRTAGTMASVAEADGRVVGFLIARVVAGEMEILNLAIESSIRRRGIGKSLLREALSWAAQNGAHRAFLEVRASNVAARKLYEAHGFSAAGIRENYYANPIEDAVVLSATLDRG